MHPIRIRPRFTVRSLMIVVAMVGILLGSSLWVIEMRTRSAAYRKRAREFGDMTCRDGSNFFLMEDRRRINLYENENTFIINEWAYKLAEKYCRLADRPWSPVDPDQPRPKLLAHPRGALDLPADYPSWHWYREPVSPWWTFPWTWRQP
jgi:hypothetical protein